MQDGDGTWLQGNYKDCARPKAEGQSMTNKEWNTPTQEGRLPTLDQAPTIGFRDLQQLTMQTTSALHEPPVGSDLPCRPTRSSEPAAATAATTAAAAGETSYMELNLSIQPPMHNPYTHPNPLPSPPPATTPFPTSTLILPTQSIHPSSNFYLDLDSNDPLSTPIQSPTDQSSVSRLTTK